jgi:uncharacterized protein with PIN domain
MREIEDENGLKLLQVRCKKCNEWLTPKNPSIISNRIISLKNDKDNHYFYCSDECKNECPIFRRSIDNLMKEFSYSTDYATWRNEVLTRQRNDTLSCYNHCEICNSEKDLHVHHEKPQKTHPHLALDPDNGIILCKECHAKFGHTGKCSSGNLAKLECE